MTRTPPSPSQAGTLPLPPSTLDGGESACPLDMSRFLIMDFVTTLEQEAARAGSLDAGSLRTLAEQFLQHMRDATFAPASCVQMHQQLMWDDRRRHPFERLLIRRFAHLLPKRVGDDGVVRGAVLSRRAIPGLAVAVTKMIGLDRYRAWESTASTIIDQHKALHPGPVDWGDVANSPACSELIERALMRMAPYFSDLNKRAQWLAEVVNSHLAPPQPEDGGILWVMDTHKAVAVVVALYADLRERLHCHPEALAAVYDARALDSLRQLDVQLGQVKATPALVPPQHA